MTIDESKIFAFRFRTDEGELLIPVRAESRQEAGAKMQKLLGRMAAEVAVDFPKIEAVGPLPGPLTKEGVPTTFAVVPAEVLDLRINTLLGDMGAGQLVGKAKADTIKLWTGHEFVEANYSAIITELELLRTGQKEIPTGKKKTS